MKATGSKSDTARLTALGSAIATRRKAKALTQEELAHRSAVALRTLQNLEGGKLNPSYKTLQAIAAGFAVPIAKMLDGL